MDKIEAIALAVKQKEGFFSPGGKYPEGSISFRTNNPGNILAGALAKELGAVAQYTSPNGLTYAVFRTLDDGFYALKKLLMWGFSGKLKSYKPEMTLAEFFKVYSGGGTTYGDFVAKKTGILVGTKVRYIYDLYWDENNQSAVASGTVTPVPVIENQDQARYEKLYLGASKSNSRYYGCKLFSITTVYNIIFGTSFTPEEINKRLLAGGAYFGANKDLIDDTTAAKILGIDFLGRETDINRAPDWSPTIKEVDFSPTAGKQQHFVVRIIKADGTKKILDPWGGVERPINYYEVKTENADWSKGGFSYRKFRKK